MNYNFLLIRGRKMENSRESEMIKVQRSDSERQASAAEPKSSVYGNQDFYNQQQVYGTKRHSINSQYFFKKRTMFSMKGRNTNLRLKNEPSDEKMRKIDEKRGKYKRSTNNSHKKYTGVAKRLMIKYLRETEINRFETVYQSFKNSRTYYFIILAHVKFLLLSHSQEEFLHQFSVLMTNKIEFYQKEIQRTHNHNFVNFRLGQIAQIQFALKALHLYFQGHVLDAIETIYKKDKTIIIKKTQYQQTIQIVKELEQSLKQRSQNQPMQFVRAPLKNPSNQDLYYHSRFVPYPERDNSLMLPNHNNQGYPFLQKRPLEKSFDQNSAADQEQHMQPSQQYPLRHLKNSYLFFQCFYPIMFPYEHNPYQEEPSLDFIYSHMQFQQLENELKSEIHSEAQKTSTTKLESCRERTYIINQSIQEHQEEVEQDELSGMGAKP